LWISGLQRRLTLKNLSFPFKVISSLWKARKIISGFKPDVVIGVGGYASGPTLRAANGKKIPTVIQEQNSYPGITNKLLAAKVAKICVAYDGMEKYFPARKIVKTGNPIRSNVIDIEGKQDEAAKFFGLDKTKKTVLIVGGSQGALAINKAIGENISVFTKNNIQLIWQTGKHYFEEANQIVKAEKYSHIKVTEFIDRMDLAYALADIIISRAGAIAISEICAVAKPPIFIPLPSAAEDHQTKNAIALVEKNAAILIKNSEVSEKIGETLLSLLNNEQQQKSLSENLKKLAIRNSAELIADEILRLINRLE
jgi:UDP-N-acetylglucosamine--N-acetylmuramyl-(pentapeptide) pyrophosphoryl-undecaprenol N-acetylglucosamine transferase